MWHNAMSSCFSTLKPYLLHCNSNHCITTSTIARTSIMATPKSIQESDVGILSYISHLPGFRGILKQRYSDFLVNEVGLDGNVVHLTNLDAPPLEVAREEVERKESDHMDRSYAVEIESFRALAGNSDAESLVAFISQVNSGSKDGVSPIVLSPDSDKAHRTAMHNFFKEKLSFLVTDTIDGPDASSKCIRVRLKSGGLNSCRNSRKRKERGDKAFDSRGSNNWPDHRGKFLRFHLYKENKDTQEAIGLIGKMLGIQLRSFGFAGTKDKRSVSTQRVTLYKVQASRLAALNDRLIGIKVGDFCYVEEELVLGKLLGNRFTVTLRGVVADSEDTITASTDSLGRHGFINYFGLQRFGSGTIPTHVIGAELLKGEWKSAVNMILDPREGERESVRKVREYYKESDDIEGTLRQLPRFLLAERSILQCLKKCPGNYLQSLKAIPRTLRMMYVHSYQSYLWNHAASMRVQKYGTNEVVAGDLVYCKENGTMKETVDFDSEYLDGNSNEIYDNTSHLDETPEQDLPDTKNTFVKALTAEDISTGNYTIDDVVLPLPGSKVIYPTNEIVQVYHDLAEKDGINLTKSKHNVKEFSITTMTGGYRPVFQKPTDFEWELLKYTDSNAPLVETDLDKIAKTKSVNVMKEGEESNGAGERGLFDCGDQSTYIDNDTKADSNEPEREAEEGLAQVDAIESSKLRQEQVALKLSFTLPTSSYATMAIRELLKTSTAVAFHRTLN